MKNWNQHTDENLMQLVQKGNEEAFNEIYQRYSQRILYFMYKMLKQDEARAQDFLQDVFLKIAAAPEKFDTNKNFKTWVFTVAANLCKNYFRQKKQPYNDLNGIEQPIANNFIPTIDNRAFEAELNQELTLLLPVYKEAFILRYYEGLSLNEIAEVVGSPLGTVKSRLHSATRILSEKLIHYQPE